MKFIYASLALLGAIFGRAEACEAPHVSVVVQFQGKSALGTQRALEFVVPLYTDCEYQTLGAPVPAGVNGPAPATAIVASFPGDGFEFVGEDGLRLDADSLNNFLAFSGDMFDPNTLLSLVICTATGSDGTKYSFGPVQNFVFKSGAPVNVVSYQCAVSFGF